MQKCRVGGPIVGFYYLRRLWPVWMIAVLSVTVQRNAAGNARTVHASVESADVTTVISDVSVRYRAKNEVNPADFRLLNLVIIKLLRFIMFYDA